MSDQRGADKVMDQLHQYAQSEADALLRGRTKPLEPVSRDEFALLAERVCKLEAAEAVRSGAVETMDYNTASLMAVNGIQCTRLAWSSKQKFLTRHHGIFFAIDDEKATIFGLSSDDRAATDWVAVK